MKKFLVYTAIALTSFIIVSCSSTTIQSTWKAPGASYTKESFKKVLVVALVQNEATRRMAEDKLAAKNPAFRASYMVLGPNQKDLNEDSIKAIVARDGYDGVVSMQLIDVQKTASYVPGYYQGGYYGWHSMNYGGYYSQGYYTEDRNYIVETNVFSIAQDKLLWSCITSTLNPTNVNKTVDEIWYAVLTRMKREKFIVPVKE